MRCSARPFPIAALAVMLLAMAVTPAEAQSPKRGGVFRLPAPDAVSLDPHQPGFTTQMYASLVYSNLVRFPAGPDATGSGDHRILPGPRREVGVVEPHHHRVYPAQGRPLSPEAAGQRPRGGAPRTSSTRWSASARVRRTGTASIPVQSIDVVDRYTVRLVLREPFAPLLNHLANPANCAILPRELDEKFKDRGQPGGGHRHGALRAPVVRARRPRRVRAQPRLLPARAAVPRRGVRRDRARRGHPALPAPRRQARAGALVGLAHPRGGAGAQADQSGDGHPDPDGRRRRPHLRARRPAALQRRARPPGRLAGHRPPGLAGGPPFRRGVSRLGPGALRDVRPGSSTPRSSIPPSARPSRATIRPRPGGSSPRRASRAASPRRSSTGRASRRPGAATTTSSPRAWGRSASAPSSSRRSPAGTRP